MRIRLGPVKKQLSPAQHYRRTKIGGTAFLAGEFLHIIERIDITSRTGTAAKRIGYCNILLLAVQHYIVTWISIHNLRLD